MAPTSVNGASFSLMERAAGPSPIMMSSWQSSRAGYRTSSTIGAQTMDLIDEQHIARLQIGQLRGQIRRALQHRAGGLAQIHAQLHRDDIGERGLAEARGTKYQHMIHGLGALTRGGDEDLHLRLDVLLAHIVGQPLRPDGAILLVLAGRGAGAGSCAFTHAIAPCSARRMSSSVVWVPAPMPLSRRRCLGRFVVQRHQRIERLAARVPGCAAPGAPGMAGWFFTRSRISIISRSALLRPTPGMRVSVVDVLRQYAAREALDTHARQHPERDLRPDTGHLEQVAEQSALLLSGEAVEDVGILAHHQVGDQMHGLTDGRQIQERGHGRFELISDAAHIHGHRRGSLGGDAPVQEADHRLTSSANRRELA